MKPLAPPKPAQIQRPAAADLDDSRFLMRLLHHTRAENLHGFTGRGDLTYRTLPPARRRAITRLLDGSPASTRLAREALIRLYAEGARHDPAAGHLVAVLARLPGGPPAQLQRLLTATRPTLSLAASQAAGVLTRAGQGFDFVSLLHDLTRFGAGTLHLWQRHAQPPPRSQP